MIARGDRLPGLSLAAISQLQVERYLAASGDGNPLHRDASIARGAGLSGTPVPGMLLMAQAARVVGAWSGCLELMSLSARFTHPLLVGEGVEFRARVVALEAEQARAIVRVTATRQEKTVLLAEAVVRLPPP